MARLKDEALTIERVPSWTTITHGRPSDRHACLAYVRLVPATDAERDCYLGRGRTRGIRPQFAQYDNGNWWQVGCMGADDIRASLDWFGGTDQNRINWGCYTGEGACYPSEVAQPKGREPELTECLRQLRARGIDPMRVATAYARRIGLGLYPSYRIGGMRVPPTLLMANEMPFFESNPQYLCQAPDGTPTPHYSFAHEAVRDYSIAAAASISDPTSWRSR